MKILGEDGVDAIPRFFADTKGFEEIAGLQIGYPLIRSKENEEIKLYLHVLIEEDMPASDFLRGLHEVRVNG